MRWRSPNERPGKTCQCVVLLDYRCSVGDSDFFIADYDAERDRFEAVVDVDGWPSDVTKEVLAWQCLPPQKLVLKAVQQTGDPAPEERSITITLLPK